MDTLRKNNSHVNQEDISVTFYSNFLRSYRGSLENLYRFWKEKYPQYPLGADVKDNISGLITTVKPRKTAKDLDAYYERIDLLNKQDSYPFQ